MKKTLLLALAVMLFANGYAQNPLWKTTTPEKTSTMPKVDRDSRPSKYKLFSVDLQALKTQLQAAPSRENTQSSAVVVAFPMADGTIQNFRIFEASCMAPELASRFPEIQSYVGLSLDDQNTTIRFSTTIFGLHVMYFTKNGVTYLDPYTKDLSNYIVYEKASLSKPTHPHDCLVTDELSQAEADRITSLRLASDGQFRTYRLAMASTIEYSAFHVNAAGLNAGTLAQKKAAVLAAMNVTMTRINGVYEKDMSLRMVLVPNNDAIIFIDSDNFSNDSAPQLINESQTVINAAIGATNYDIGHTVSTGGGGLAQSPSVCLTGSKARGITGSPAPVGDSYDIDFVAHEMGHQFGASHTFNGTTAAADGNCTTGTRAPGFAVEPGSGTTIMAYAGICGVQDVQAHSDAYFHAVSIGQMVSHVTGSGACSVNVANGNTAPVANAGLNYIIPKSTAFVLKGAATDANGDALTYSWEQLDNEVLGVTQPPVATATGGPNYKSEIPSTSPNRYLPRLQDVVAGNLVPKWEVTPSVGRVMDFALTVRDNRSPNGGQTGRDDMTVTFVNAAGPFAVTSQNTDALVLAPNSAQTVTWNVAGTTANGINTANVNILLSSDNGVTFPTVLVANTPNDGSQAITLPNISAANCRIMVESVGNIFYAVNSKNIAIGNYQYSTQNICEDYSFDTGIPIPESATSYSGFALNIPASYTLTDVNINPVFTHPNMGNVYFAVRPPFLAAPAIARLSSGSCAGTANLDLVYDSQGTAVVCGASTSGAATLPQDTFNTFNGQNPSGDWVFFIVDIAPNDGITGTWDSINFNLCRTESVATLATQQFDGLQDFTIYPNPNNGAFNVKFSSASSNTIKIAIHDIQGRKIFSKSFENTGLFDERLQLNNVQSGVYLVTVQDGNTKEVRRIVIN